MFFFVAHYLIMYSKIIVSKLIECRVYHHEGCLVPCYCIFKLISNWFRNVQHPIYLNRQIYIVEWRSMELYRLTNHVKVISNSLSASHMWCRPTSFINEENIFGNVLFSTLVIIRSLIRGFHCKIQKYMLALCLDKYYILS